jgi:mannose-6-phosphate isomerase-like protein (cupin superfamily)
MLKSGRVILKPGEDVGAHVTDNREEIILVLKGMATIMVLGKESVVTSGNHYYIGPNIVHNIKNNTDSDLEYVYVVALFDGINAKEHSHDDSTHEHSHNGHVHKH